MRRSIARTFIAWLCLITFGLGSTVLQTGLVVCTDGHGESRVEWACSQNSDGECITSCGSDAEPVENDPGAPHPCDDTPLQADPVQAQSAPRQTDLPTAIAPVLVAILDWREVEPPSLSAGRTLPPAAHPPDAASRLRSVILIV